MKPYKSTLIASLSLLTLTTLFVIFSYFYIDRGVVFWVAHHSMDHFVLLKGMTYIPEVFAVLAPLAILWYLSIRCWRQAYNAETVAFVIGCTVIIVTYFKNGLKWVFGRTWPATWKASNPSLLRDGVYGFSPFHGGVAYQSLPSGHATVTLAVMVILWYAYPRLRWLYVLVSIGVPVGLIGMNYHFVSDVLAGACLGTIAGWCAYHWLESLTNVSSGSGPGQAISRRWRSHHPGSKG